MTLLFNEPSYLIFSHSQQFFMLPSTVTSRYNKVHRIIRVRRNNKKDLYLNTGWTTYVDYNVNALAELITAHELGHSWGADHDPDTDECNPAAISSGKYLMYTYSVSGYAENNGKFSPCSLRTIGACLVTRAPLCFEDSSAALSNLCGNSRIDEGEECDVGRNPHDPCCSSECYFRTGAHCSPWNHGCCTSAPKNTICAQTSSTNPCLGPGQCNGLSSICPGPTLLSGGQCDEYGRCFQGKCHPFCSSLGLETCICDSGRLDALIIKKSLGSLIKNKNCSVVKLYNRV
ncbi:unnamed protein product [Schistosoma curassoni]|uniref:Disintegrin domain-containing protein n=1 Tax=Schistosoma curassoni TaxID=6186 RepID=A0A183JPW4_9TREM|nr:unnamed protein product [Schistosoma curassoni]